MTTTDHTSHIKSLINGYRDGVVSRYEIEATISMTLGESALALFKKSPDANDILEQMFKAFNSNNEHG